MTVIAALTGEQFEPIRQALGAEVETAWVLTARVTSERVVVARQVIDIPGQAYRRRTARRLEISSGGFVPAFEQARRAEELAVFVHTHPGVQPHPSDLDDEVDRELVAFAAARGLSGYIALNFGGTPQAPRLYGRAFLNGAREPETIDRVRVASPQFRVILGEHEARPRPPSLFDRQVRALGPEGQRLLSALRVGVVGAGGTGSPSVEMLARMGFGELVVIDDDEVSDTNLTRIHASTSADVGTPKVELAKTTAESYGTGTTVTMINGTVASVGAIRALSRCDVVLGCTDDHAGRLVLSKLAYQYLVPVIDCGVMVSSAGGRLRGVDGRVTVIAPGARCLVCRGQVDLPLAGQQMMDPEERRRLAGEGYAAEAGAPDPAVVVFTTATAAMAVNELLARLLGYGGSEPAEHLLVQFHSRQVRHTNKLVLEQHSCTDSATWGLGDTNPPLNLLGIAA